MKRIALRVFSILIVAALVGPLALAAGTEKKPKTDQRPGVADYNAGVDLMKQKDFAAAAAKFEAALAANPTFAEAHNNLGYALRKQGAEHYEQALAHYDKAIELDPELAEAYMYRGVLHGLMGHEDLALADHATLVTLNRKLAERLQAAIASGEEPDGLEGLAKAW